MQASSKVSGADVGLLMIRVMLAVVFMYHGSQKLFQWFDGPGMEGFVGGLTSMGIPFPQLSAYLAACAEFFGGLALGLGVATRLAAVPVTITMMVASFVAHGGAFSLQAGGMEYALTLGVVTASLILLGPGRLSVDGLIFRNDPRPAAKPATA